MLRTLKYEVEALTSSCFRLTLRPEADLYFPRRGQVFLSFHHIDGLNCKNINNRSCSEWLPSMLKDALVTDTERNFIIIIKDSPVFPQYVRYLEELG